MNPLVSICIPVYNSEQTIGKTIKSLLQQEYKNIEIIVVDNCSTDKTVDIIRSFTDPRLSLYLNPDHLPRGEYNWNRCFKYPKGELMAIFHADDVYLPNMISRQVETFRICPAVGAVFTEGNIIDENDNLVGKTRLPHEIVSGLPYVYHQIVPITMKYGDFFRTSSAMVRTSLYRKMNAFDIERYDTAADFDMWLRIVKESPVVILDEPLMNYRISKEQGSNVLNRVRFHEADYFKVMKDRLEGYEYSLPEGAMDNYELLRFGDSLVRVSNLMKSIPWGRYFRIILRNPGKMYDKVKLFLYFQRFKA